MPVRIPHAPVTPPDEEPLTLLEARMHLREPAAQEDALIMGLIIAARGHAESVTGRRLITQTWDVMLDAFPCDALELPYPPLRSVSSVSYVDEAGAPQVLDSSRYQVDIKSDPGRIALAYGQSWPSHRSGTLNPVSIRFVCGYGTANSVPKEIKQAMLFMIGHWFKNREEVADFERFPLPLGATALLAPFRIVRV